ncbi:MAG: zinc ribbon domain-containing protein [Blastocatellia bacterium]
MFCPKCGGEAVEGQRFCKSCGTNLQLIYNAIKSGDTPQGPFGLDLDALKQSAMDFANSWKTNWAGITHEHEKQWDGVTKEQKKPVTAREKRRLAREELQRRNLPRPREWMAYSWQHNLKIGIGSLLSGAGLGILLYYLGQEAINSHLLEQIPKVTEEGLRGLEYAARMLWMISLIPMLKGLGHIIYAAFFAESLATLSDRYTVRDPVTGPLTTHQPQRDTAQTDFEALTEPPASVTENTTKFFEEARVQTKRESQ